ncbi:MAG: YceI family protein, partial [Acidimicrobiales bacterium]|nr:YceI family protein [Acidimicrobiales bacterium]
FEGSVKVDNSISGQATVKVDSINTGDKVRDSHLTSNEVFSCSKFPEINFQMTGFRPSQVGLVVTGDLTVKGVTSPIELDVTTIPELDKFDGGPLKILATSKLSRKTFGLTWNALIEMGSAVVSDLVDLELVIQLIPQN